MTATPEMVERVAEKLCARRPELFMEQCREIVRHVIEAMAEPTGAMSS